MAKIRQGLATKTCGEPSLPLVVSLRRFLYIQNTCMHLLSPELSGKDAWPAATPH